MIRLFRPVGGASRLATSLCFVVVLTTFAPERNGVVAVLPDTQWGFGFPAPTHNAALGCPAIPNLLGHRHINYTTSNRQPSA